MLKFINEEFREMGKSANLRGVMFRLGLCFRL